MKKEKLRISIAKAKVLLGKYVKKFKCQIFLALLLNILGMAQELASPLFIGYIIDAITDRDFERVKRLTMYWLIITIVGGVFNGIQSFVFFAINQKFG